KGALMVIEPPGELRRARIFEIHNRIFVAVEHSGLERLRRFMRHPGIQELRRRVHPLPVQTRKDGGGCRPVEAFVVKTDANLHRSLLKLAPMRKISPLRAKLIKMAGGAKIVKLKAEGNGSAIASARASERRSAKGQRSGPSPPRLKMPRYLPAKFSAIPAAMGTLKRSPW